MQHAHRADVTAAVQPMVMRALVAILVLGVGLAAGGWMVQRGATADVTRDRDEARSEVAALEARVAELERVAATLPQGASTDEHAAGAAMRADVGAAATTGAAGAMPFGDQLASVVDLDQRTGDLERQMSLAMMVLLGAVGTRSSGDSSVDAEVGDDVVALRADVDLLLTREWTRLESEEALAEQARADAAEAAGVDGVDGDQADGLEPQESPEEDEAEAEGADQQSEEPAEASEPDGQTTWTVLAEASDKAFVRSFSTMAQLDEGQETQLTAALDGLRGDHAEIVGKVLRGDASAIDAQIEVRELHIAARKKMERLLKPGQRDALRREVQLRQDLLWNIAAGSGW